ncbi:hypothetical protein ABIE69_001191 [Rhodobacteraceae bacterium MBR-64]
MSARRVLAVLTVRNEAAFLLDWLAHHRAVGFTDFLVFSNDCDDGTDALLERLQTLGLITHVPNPGPHPQGPQWAALKHADKHPLRAAADWVMVLDIDEYVTVRVGDHTLAALFAALPGATAIPLTWRLFGNAGVVGYADQPVTAQFTLAAPRILYWPWRASLFKTLFRNDGTYRKLGVHRPRGLDPARAGMGCWMDGSGRKLPEIFESQRIFSPFGRDNYALAQLNHYALGAMESYVVKCDRGRANREAAPFDMAYWVERNFSAEADDSGAALAPATRAERATLAADATLANLHDAAVRWRRARFAALMADEPWRALFGRLMMTPPTRPLTAQEAAVLIGYGNHAKFDP